MRRRRNQTRASQIAGGALSLFVLAAAIVGLPLVLYAAAGSPIPHAQPHWHQVVAALGRHDNGTLFLAVLRDLGWASWFCFTASTAVEAVCQVRGKAAPRLRGIGGVQHLSRTLVASVVVAFTAAGAGLPAALPAVAAVAATAPATHPQPGAVLLDFAQHPRPDQGAEITVPHGANLWDIAELHTGNPERWHQLWHLNRGRVMPSGARFTDPNIVEAGCRLRLPASWSPRHAAATNGTGRRDHHDASQARAPASPDLPAAAAPPGATGEAEAAGTPVAPQAASLTTVPRQAGSPAGLKDFAAGVLAGGMLAGGVALALRRRRHHQRQQRPPGRRIALPVSAPARRAEYDLGTAAAQPLPGVLRGALAALADGLRASGQHVPGIAGIHITAQCLEVLLTEPDPAAPAPFTVKPETQECCWVLDSVAWGALPSTNGTGRGDLLPGLVTMGTTPYGGHLLADLEALGVTTVGGPPQLADVFLTGAGLELATNPWAGAFDLLLAGFDGFDGDGRAQACATLDEAIGILADRAAGPAPEAVRDRRLHDPACPDWTLTLLVSRIPPDPSQMAQLLDTAAPNSGIAALVAGDITDPTGREAPASLDLREQPDGPATAVAVLHPLELLLTVPGPGDQHYEAITEIFQATAAPDVGPDDPPYNTTGLADGWAPQPEPPFGSGHDPGWAAAGDPLAAPAGAATAQAVTPGSEAGVCIAILGPFQITGTAAKSMQPKHRELVLALALAGQAGLANSKLRTYLGPDQDTPKSSDSLRQMITRTRRELGKTPDGEEYIRHIGEARYALAAPAWLDWDAFAGLAEAGHAAQDRGLLWEALALIRGEALDGVYYWWVEPSLPERIRAKIVDTACELATLELAHQDPAAAGRAARAGLDADRAAETLWRALMQAEHNAGNAAEVHQAWQDCRAALADVAPDIEPHERTTALYHQLTRRRAVPAHT
jgi:DNA-binding SARP family transcriptional activator